jgi:hypothetical protein
MEAVMTSRAKDRIKRLIAGHALLRRMYGAFLILRWRREFERLGIVESQLRGEPVDSSGHPVPWLSLPALALLEERVQPGWSVLEYGSGNSTLWWGRRAFRVVSVEHDAAFHARLAPRLPGHVIGLLVSDVSTGAYEQAPVGFGRIFDVVVIDGIRRVECVIACLSLLKETGVILFDNADAKAYAPGLDHLREQGFRRLDLRGLYSLMTWSDTTSIFYRDGNCLGL